MREALLCDATLDSLTSGVRRQAIDLCFRSRLFGALRDIAQTLDSDTDPQLLHRCAEFFLDHGQYDRTVHLFTVAGEYSKVYEIVLYTCVEQLRGYAYMRSPPSLANALLGCRWFAYRRSTCACCTTSH